VTGQVTFGDLLDVADRHLELAGKIPRRPRSDKELPDFARSLHGLVTVIGSYLRNDPADHEEIPLAQHAAPDDAESLWEMAGRQARPWRRWRRASSSPAPGSGRCAPLRPRAASTSTQPPRR
jgi:hypothetical protein